MIGIKIMSLAIIGALLSLVLKEQKTFFGITTSFLCALVVFFMGIPYLERIVCYVKSVYSSFGGVQVYMGTLLKITAVAMITLITSGLCSDSGMSALSGVVTFCGKVICLFMTLPVMSELFDEILSVLP